MKKIIWVVVLLVIGGGVYWYVNNTELVVEPVNSKFSKLSDETVDSLLDTLKTTEFKGQIIESGFVGASKITKGDLNSDGLEDVIFVETYCGASCGSSLMSIINQGDGTGKFQEIKQDEYILTSSAAQTEITNIEVDNGVVKITANGFKGETDWNKSVTKKFKIEDSLLLLVNP